MEKFTWGARLVVLPIRPNTVPATTWEPSRSGRSSIDRRSKWMTPPKYDFTLE